MEIPEEEMKVKWKDIDLIEMSKTMPITEIANLIGTSEHKVEKRIKKLSTPKPSKMARQYNKSNLTLPYRELLK